jgi:hypothetical protein
VSGAGSGPAAVTLVIRNTGNVRITGISTDWVNAPDGAPTLVPVDDNPLDPGKTKVLTAEGDGFVRRKAMRKAGLGALEAILITIVVIVLVVVAWFFLSGFLGSAMVNPKAAIQQFDITVSGAGTGPAVVTLVVKNTGNVRIDRIETEWINDPGGAPNLLANNIALDPGKTYVLSDTGSGFVVGNQYSIRVRITYTNGAIEVLTATATAHP